MTAVAAALKHLGGEALGPLYLLAATPALIFLISGRATGDYISRRHPRAQSAIETAGNTTYSSYLLHFPLQLATVLVLDRLGISLPFDKPWVLLAYLLSVLLLSVLVYRHFELPMQAAIRRLRTPRIISAQGRA